MVLSIWYVEDFLFATKYFSFSLLYIFLPDYTLYCQKNLNTTRLDYSCDDEVILNNIHSQLHSQLPLSAGVTCMQLHMPESAPTACTNICYRVNEKTCITWTQRRKSSLIFFVKNHRTIKVLISKLLKSLRTQRQCVNSNPFSKSNQGKLLGTTFTDIYHLQISRRPALNIHVFVANKPDMWFAHHMNSLGFSWVLKGTDIETWIIFCGILHLTNQEVRAGFEEVLQTKAQKWMIK